MAYTYELPNMSGGFDNLLVGISSSVPAFVPMFLFTIYGIITIGGMIAQKNRTGFADVPMWSTIGSMAILLIALSMTTVAGMIEPTYIVIVVLMTIMSGVWLFLNQNRNEV